MRTATLCLFSLTTALAAQDPSKDETAVDPVARAAAILADSAAAKNTAQAAQALEALRELGSMAIVAEPDLIARTAEGPHRQAHLRALAWLACWLPGDAEYRDALWSQLGAPPDGDRAAQDWHVQLRRLHVRLGGGERSVAELGHRLAFGNALEADMALDALSAHGDAGREALFGLRVRLTRPDTMLLDGTRLDLRRRAIERIEALSDDPNDLRMARQFRGYKDGSGATPVRPAPDHPLTRRLADLAAGVPEAVDAFRDAGPEVLPVLLAVLDAYHSPAPPPFDARAAICALLAELGPRAAGAARSVWTTLRSAPPRALPEVLDALAAVGPWASPPLPWFDVTVDRDAGTVRLLGQPLHADVGAEALAAIGAAAERCARRLAMDPGRLPIDLGADLADPSEPRRTFAAEALQVLGAPGYPATEALRAALHPAALTDPETPAADRAAWLRSRLAAARALAAVRAKFPADAAPAWGLLLTAAPAAFERAEAARGIATCGHHARPHVDRLVDALDDPGSGVARAAADALGELAIPCRDEVQGAIEPLRRLAARAQDPELAEAATRAAERIEAL